jgi:hypothetical protein
MCNGRSIIVCAAIASALGWALPAMADEAAPRSDLQYLGLKGRLLSDDEMGEMRGRFMRGNRAMITVDGTTTSDYDPNVPGSASVTVNLGPNTISKASASTSGTSGYASASVTITGVTFGGSSLTTLGGASLRRR